MGEIKPNQEQEPQPAEEPVKEKDWSMADEILKRRRDEKRVKMTPEELAEDDKSRKLTEDAQEFFKKGKGTGGIAEKKGLTLKIDDKMREVGRRHEKLKADHDAHVAEIQRIKEKLDRREPITAEERRLIERPATKLFRDLMEDK